MPWPIECGPYFLHGSKHSLLFDLVKKEGWPYQSVDWPQYFYLERERRWINAQEGNEDIDAIEAVMHKLTKAGPRSIAPWKSLRNYFKDSLPDRLVSLAENIYANDIGSDGEGIGASAMAEEEQKWIYGEDYILLRDGDWRRVITTLSRGLSIHTNAEVSKQIAYTLSHRAHVRFTFQGAFNRLFISRRRHCYLQKRQEDSM